MDPITLSLIAAGGQALAGGLQSAFSGRKRAERNMERLANQSPMLSSSPEIGKYYNEALSRYNENPMQSQLYQNAMLEAQRGTSTALNALQDRRSGIAGVSRLVGQQNLAAQRAGVAAEQQRNLRFSQLGSAAQAKRADDLRSFDVNQMQPYMRRFGLAQFKAQAANQRQAAGLQTIAGGLSNLGTAAMFSQGDKVAKEKVTPNLPDVKVSALPQAMADYMKNQDESLIDMPDVKVSELPYKMYAYGRDESRSPIFEPAPNVDILVNRLKKGKRWQQDF